MDDDKDDADLYTMDADKTDGDGTLMPTVIVEEEAGTVALKSVSEQTKPRQNGVLDLEDKDMDEEGSEDDEDDEIGGWEDMYKQEG